MADKQRKTDLRSLTFADTRYLPVFYDDWWGNECGEDDCCEVESSRGYQPQALDVVERPIDVKRAKQLSKDTGLKYEIAWLLQQSLRYQEDPENTQKALDKNYVWNIRGFIDQAGRFLQVKELLYGKDWRLKDEARSYINQNHWQAAELLPADYRRAATKRTVLFLAILAGLIWLAITLHWKWFSVGVFATALIGLATISGMLRTYRAKKRFVAYAKDKGFDLIMKKPEPKPAPESAPKDVFTETFKEEMKQGHDNRSTWWLVLCMGIGLVLMPAGVISFFYGHDRIFGVVFFCFGVLYSFGYGSQLYARFKAGKRSGKK